MATAERVIARLNELSQYFPHGLQYKVAYETTSFVKSLDYRCGENAAGGDSAGVLGHVFVLAELPRDP